MVRLRHESISREAFGNGIIFALDNMTGKSKGLYSMDDLLLPFFHLNSSEQEYIEKNTKPWWRFW